ncbi:MAG: ester cyclase [Thermomicrobiales bacterium]
MKLDELKARARRIPEEILTQGDLAVADELIDPECCHHTPQPISPGIEGVKAWVQALRRAFLDLRAVVEDEIAERDTVVQRLTLGGTHEGPLFGLLPTGRRVEWQEVDILRVGANGKFTETWSYWDRHDLLQQLGAPPGIEEDN